MNKDEIKKVLQRCSAVDFKTSRSDCPDCYRLNDLLREARCIIIEQEKKIERLIEECNWHHETLAKYRMASEKEIRAQKKQAVKEFAKKLKARITKFIGRHDLSVRFFNDIVSDLLKEYEK